MPHDKSGQKLEVGDIVTVTYRVKELYEGADTCDVKLEALDGKEGFFILCDANSVQRIGNESLQQAADRGFKEAQP